MKIPYALTFPGRFDIAAAIAMESATEGLTPSNSSQQRDDLDLLSQEVQSAAQALLGKQEDLKARVGSLGGAVPREASSLAAEFSKAAAALLKATEQLTTAWTAALASVQESTAIAVAHQQVEQFSLQKLARGDLEPELRSLKEALLACQTWDALKEEAMVENLDLERIPPETSLGRIPELIAAKQIETRARLERLAAPRILQNTLAEMLAGEAPPASPEGLLSPTDWRTIVEEAPRDAKLSPLHGLALRCCSESEPSRLVADGKNLLTQFQEAGVAKNLAVLGFLSRGQFISLWSGLPEYARELQAILVAGLLCSQRPDYWFWEPLEEFTRPGRQSDSKWRSLLHQLAQATIAEDGFESLKQLVRKIPNTPATPVADPRQALRGLQDRLREPLNCTDRSRFRLRQRAYQDLLTELRAAVLAADLPGAKQEYEKLTQVELANYYDRYASEIHLTSRSLRDHFIQDIQEVLQFTAQWLDASDTSHGNSQNASLIESLRHCLPSPQNAVPSSDPDERPVAALGRYLLAWSQNEAAASVSADFPPETPPLFEQTLPTNFVPSAAEWRSFGARVERGETTWADWSLDQMDSWAGNSSPKIALHRFLRFGQLEAAVQAQQACAAAGIALEPELAERITALTGARRADLAAKREAVQIKLSTLNPEDRQALEHDLEAVPNSLSAKSVRDFETGLAVVQRRCDEATTRYEDHQRRAQIATKLIALGQTPDPTASLQELERVWRLALESTSAQRAHIEPLRQFQTRLRELPFTELCTAAEQAILSLEAVENWRDLPKTADIELYFDTLFLEMLGPLLAQAYNWLPDRRLELLTLTLSWLEALRNPAWLKNSTSPCWRALLATAELQPQSFQTSEGLRILRDCKVPLSKVFAPEPTAALPQPQPSPVPPTPTIEPQEKQRLPSSPASLAPQRKPSPTPNPPRQTPISGTLVELQAALDSLLPPAAPLALSDLRKALEHQQWALAADLAGAGYRQLEEGGIANGQYARDLLIDFAAATILASPDETRLDLDVTARLLHLVNQHPDVAIRTNQQAERTIEQLFTICLTQAWAAEHRLSEKTSQVIFEDFRAYARKLTSDPIPSRLTEWFSMVFTPCSADAKQSCLMVDTAWSKFPRDTAIRGWLIWMCLQSANWPAMQRLLIKSNPEVITLDQAHYFQLLADERNANWQRFESFVAELRQRSRERPVFLNFTERLFHARQVSKPSPVSVQLIGLLQQQRDGKTWTGQLHIDPPEIDPPATLTVTLPETADIRFAPGENLSIMIEGGPFLWPTQVYCNFFLLKENLREQRLQVRCTGKTLGENTFDLLQEWEVRLRKELFEPPNVDQISAIFRDFSSNPVQGKDYVERPWDERTIQHILFEGDKPGSLWLRAPRRSGKTSMLLRQMQTFGCCSDRPTDSGIILIEVGSWNHSDKSLSQHIWEQLWSAIRNRPLARIFAKEAVEGSQGLTEESNVGTFMQKFAEFLISQSPLPLKRIYYFLDEADNLRGMHYSQDFSARERCRSLLWQVRGLIQATSNVGVLFCTATAADRIFAERPESPFYNSIPRYALKAFSTETPEMETAAREILQPPPLRQQFESLPPETVRHMLRITCGIPYYMKSVAGAAYASARSGYISRSDVNRATELLLGKKIGSVARELESPGMDELSVLDGDGSADRRVLAKAVMLAAANLLSGFDHPYLLRGDLLREDGPLKKEGHLPEKLIREGLESLLELGFLATPPEKSLHLEFSIPILGESLRAEFRKLWNDLLHQIEEIASADAKPPVQLLAQRSEPASLRAEAEKYLRQEILNAEYEGKEFFVSSAGALLQSQFPDPENPAHERPLYQRLGFWKLVDFLESIEGIRVEGVAPRLTLKMASPTELRSRIEGATSGPALELASPAELRSRVISAILEIIEAWESSGRHLTAAVLGNQLLIRFPGGPPHHRLGFQSLAGFLYSVREITVEGQGVHKFIRQSGSARPRTQPTA